MPLSGLLAVPAAAALLDQDLELGFRLAPACLGFFVGALAASRVSAPKNVQENEILACAALIFLVSSLVMALPLGAAGLSPLDAFFESTSAMTTTGLSMVPDVRDVTAAFLFTRSWMQWLGGLVVLVLALAFVIEPGAAAKRLGGLASDAENTRESSFVRGRRILAAYAVLTAIGFVAIWILEGDAFSALIHALSAVSTGGFSIHQDSLAGLRAPAARWAVTALSFAGAVSLLLYFAIFTRGVASFGAASEAKGLAVISALVVIALAVSLSLGSGIDPWEAVTTGLLLGLSAQTTTGYSTLAVGGLAPLSMALLLVAMAVGGSSGSTAGGIKVFRLLVALRLTRLVLLKVSSAPHARPILRLGGRRVASETVQRAFAVILLYMTVCFLSWLAFLGAGYPPLGSLFEVISALSTVGLSAGIATPDLPAPLKLVLCGNMLLGRLEILAFLVLLYPRNWIVSRRETK